MTINRESLAWAAGFYEGEGSIHSGHVQSKGRLRRRAPLIQIAQVSREPLERFRAAVGVGTIAGPYAHSTPDRSARRPYFMFHCTRFEHAQAIAAMLWPWLSRRRRDQIRSAYEQFHAVELGKPGRPARES